MPDARVCFIRVLKVAPLFFIGSYLPYKYADIIAVIILPEVSIIDKHN